MRSFMRIGLGSILTLAVVCTGFSQVPAAQPAPVVPSRIPQQIIINGQRVNGAYVPAANGGMQTFTCSAPQQYVIPDSATQGWACFEQATNVWLLNAFPPSAQTIQQAPAPVQSPPVIYPQPPAVIYQQPVPATVIYTTSAPVIYALSPRGCAWVCGNQCSRQDRERRDTGFTISARLLRRAWIPAMVI